jgi:hypothetical protein
MTVMRPYTTPITGGFVAECPACHVICAYWDDDDLDDDGNLLCFCDEQDD